MFKARWHFWWTEAVVGQHVEPCIIYCVPYIGSILCALYWKNIMSKNKMILAACGAACGAPCWKQLCPKTKWSYRQKLAEGSVRLLGGKPGDRSLGLPGNLVGYMPQSTRLVMLKCKMDCNHTSLNACSLFMEFTISETFSYFGRLLHMTRDQVSIKLSRCKAQ